MSSSSTTTQLHKLLWNKPPQVAGKKEYENSLRKKVDLDDSGKKNQARQHVLPIPEFSLKHDLYLNFGKGCGKQENGGGKQRKINERKWGRVQ